MGSSGTVQTTFIIKGEDQASAEIEKVNKSLKKTSDELHSAAGHSAGLNEQAEHSAHTLGRLGGLARPLAGFFGEAKGEVRELGHSLHAIHGILSLLPGPVAALGLAASAAGIAMAWMHKNAEEAAKKSQEAEAKKLEKLKQNKAELAEYMGISAELLGVDESHVDHAAELVRLGGELVENQNELAKAQREGDKEAAAAAENARIDLKIEIDLARERAEIAKQAAENAREVAREEREAEHARAFAAHVASSEYEMQLANAGLLHDKRRREHDIAALHATRLLEVEKELAKAREIALVPAMRTEATVRRVLELERESLKIQAQISEESAKAAKHRASHRIDWAAKGAELETKDIAAVEAVREAAARKELALSAQLAADPAAKALQQLELAKMERAKELAKIIDSTQAGERNQKAATMAVERAFAAEQSKILHDQGEAEKKAADESIAQAQRVAKERIGQARSVAHAAVGFAEQIGVGEQARAYIEATIAAAEAIAAFPDPALMAAKGLGAAALFAAAGKQGSGAAPAAGSSGSYSSPSIGSSAGTGSGGPRVTVIQYGFGTLQQLHRGLQDAIGASKNTGYASGTV